MPTAHPRLADLSAEVFVLRFGERHPCSMRISQTVEHAKPGGKSDQSRCRAAGRLNVHFAGFYKCQIAGTVEVLLLVLLSKPARTDLRVTAMHVP